MLCDQCGASNPDINRFCGACGAAIFRRPDLWQPKPEPPEDILPLNVEPELPSVETPVEEQDVIDESVVEETPLEKPFFQEARILHENEARAEPPIAVQEREREIYTPISGPSLLGLSGSDDYSSDEPTTYTLDEEEDRPKSHIGWYIFAVVAMAVVATFGILEYRTIKTGKVAIPWFSSSRSEEPKATDEADNSAATAGAPVQQQAKTPQPLTSDEAPPVKPSAPDQHASAATTKSPAHETANNKASDSGSGPTMEIVEKKPAAAASTPQPKPETTASSAPPPKPDAAADKTTTTSAESRLAQQNAEKRKQEMAKAINEDEAETPDVSSGSTAKAVAAPTRSSASKPADPRQNRLLLAGERFLYGRGGRRDCNQAVAYFQAAAKEYNGPAMSHLGAMYASGNCVKPDRLTAYKWFARAQEAQPNNPWLGKNMNMLWRQMTPEERASISR
jgi:hypothetical protein